MRLLHAAAAVGSSRGRGVPFLFFVVAAVEESASVEKYKHIIDRQLIMGQDLSIVQRGGPSTLPMALHFFALDISDKELQLFQMNQLLNYLLQTEHVARFDGENYIYIPLLLIF